MNMLLPVSIRNIERESSLKREPKKGFFSQFKFRSSDVHDSLFG